MLIGGWWLKEWGAYFKVKGILHLKFQSLVIISLQITINNYHYGVLLQILQNYWLLLFLSYFEYLLLLDFELVALKLESNF